MKSAYFDALCLLALMPLFGNFTFNERKDS